MVDTPKDDKSEAPNTGPSGKQFDQIISETAEVTRKMIDQFLAGQPSGKLQLMDPLNLAPSFLSFGQALLSDPEKLINRQMDFLADYWRLVDATRQQFQQGSKPADITNNQRPDRRFKSDAWSEGPFHFFKQFYLLSSKHVMDTVAEISHLDEDEKQKLSFYTRQYLDALSPSNFAVTNPDVLKATLESQGQNLVSGMQNLLEDLERGDGLPMIKMTDLDAFEVGRNIAITPGKVVFRNTLFELIQYSPQTDEVYTTPLLIFPPWINKYYILDLSAEKSFVRWAVEQGYTVFMVSWVNPGSEHRDYGFDAYLHQGYLEAMTVVQEITGQPSTHVIGYCVAGTMLAATMAYLHAKGKGDWVKTATFLTAQVDFSEAGELSVFIDEEQIATIDRMMESKGYLDKKTMAMTFNALRANDLIWSYVVNNYLLGKEPPAFDLLFWNSDATNLSRKMHKDYLEQMYRQNNLIRPGAIKIDGVPIDLGKIETPIFVQAGRQDHIAPPQSVHKITQYVKGPVRFVMAGSGHIAGVVNPPSAQKYQYWTADENGKDLDEFIAQAKEHPGSWWPEWLNWLEKRSGKKLAARDPGKGPYPVLEDAPGTYVKE